MPGKPPSLPAATTVPTAASGAPTTAAPSQSAVLAALRRAFEGGLLPPDRLWVVAVSGGLDSAVLLHAMHALAPECRWRLRVAHYDHRMRPGSDADAKWVRRRAHALGLPFTLGGRASKGGSMSGVACGWGEAEARRHRRRFLVRTARRHGAAGVLLAHHAQDQAETVLLHILRGAGARGAAGMVPRRGRFVRPLLAAPHEALLAYARHHGLEHVEDPTNGSAIFTRNRLRLAVMQPLKQAFPQAAARICATAGRVGADDRLLRRQASRWLAAHDRAIPAPAAAPRPVQPGARGDPSAEAWVCLPRGSLAGLPQPVAVRVLQGAYGRALRREARQRHRLRLAPARLPAVWLNRLLKMVHASGPKSGPTTHDGSRVDIPGGLRASIHADALELRSSPRKKRDAGRRLRGRRV